MHTHMQTCSCHLPFLFHSGKAALCLIRPMNSSVQSHSTCGGKELCNSHNSLLQSDCQLCGTKVSSYSACPPCWTKASSCSAQKMCSTMVTPCCVYKMWGTKVSHAAQELRDISICASVLEYFCREKFPG